MLVTDYSKLQAKDKFKISHFSILIKIPKSDFPGGPVVKSQHFHYRGRGLDPWSGKFCMLHGAAKKKKKKISIF